MGLLIKNLLTFSKVGGKVLEFKKVSLQKIVEEKLLDLGMIINSKNVEIEVNDLPTIYCEKFQISMLFYNLINNAIKFNDKESPKVTISDLSDPNESYWKFSVEDNGIGIAPEFQDQIFEIFKRLHNKDEYEGTGIGLALCNKIINRHKGEISVESIKGLGTKFIFTIDRSLQKMNNIHDNLALHNAETTVLN